MQLLGPFPIVCIFCALLNLHGCHYSDQLFLVTLKKYGAAESVQMFSLLAFFPLKYHLPPPTLPTSIFLTVLLLGSFFICFYSELYYLSKQNSQSVGQIFVGLVFSDIMKIFGSFHRHALPFSVQALPLDLQQDSCNSQNIISRDVERLQLLYAFFLGMSKLSPEAVQQAVLSSNVVDQNQVV